MRRTTDRLTQIVATLALALLFVVGDSKPARAEANCFINLRACYFRAAAADTWSTMWRMGLDCELDFTDCARRAVLGR